MGGLYSNDGPVAQMYDQSDENGAAIVGFLDDSTADWTESQRQEAVIDQLVRVFGDKAQGYKTYKDTAWRNEPFTMPTGGPDYQDTQMLVTASTRCRIWTVGCTLEARRPAHGPVDSWRERCTAQISLQINLQICTKHTVQF